MKIHILGIRHEYQYLSPKFAKEKKQLRLSIIELLNAIGTSILAEEFSRYALVDVNKSEATILQKVAKKRGLLHLFCDPNPEQRRSLREPYMGEFKHRPREEYWLSILENHAPSLSRVIFLCGSDHLDSFAALCKERGHGVEGVRKIFE